MLWPTHTDYSINLFKCFISRKPKRIEPLFFPSCRACCNELNSGLWNGNKRITGALLWFLILTKKTGVLHKHVFGLVLFDPLFFFNLVYQNICRVISSFCVEKSVRFRNVTEMWVSVDTVLLVLFCLLLCFSYVLI